MKRILLAIAIAFTVPACVPDEKAIVKECQAAVDEAIAQSFEECTNYYETIVIPQFLLLIEQLKEFIAETCTPV